MKKVSFPSVVTYQGDQVQVEFPDLPDAITKRDSLATAISDSRLAIALVVNDLLTHFEEVPPATPVADVRAHYPHGDVRLITVDLDQY